MYSLNEAAIKAAVIDKLLGRHVHDDAVLISEMVTANGARRADLAVANGYLHAFEIKSDLDTLVRLDGQLNVFAALFDKVTVVVTPKFTACVLETLPKSVEVWEVRSTINGDVRITVRRRGECRPVRSPAALGSFLKKTDLAVFLRSEGIQARADQPRSDLQRMLAIANVTRLRQFVLVTIKKRYRLTHDAFMERRRKTTMPEDLVALKRTSLSRANDTVGIRSLDKLDSGSALTQCERAVDGDRLSRRYGLAIQDIPRTVLTRAASQGSSPVLK